MLKILLILALSGVLVYAGIIGYVTIRESKVARRAADIRDSYDAIIVLGAQVKPDGTPSVQLSLRLDLAAEAWENRNVPVVVCGAQGADEPEPEAFAMKKYLTARGIPGEMVLTDPESFNTEQNLQNAKQLLAAYPEEIRKPVIVSSDYHVPRAMAIAKDLGIDASGIGSPCMPEFWIKNHTREALAWCKYWLKKLTGLKL